MRSRKAWLRPKARQRGASALELALISLVAFVPVLFGIVQLGLVFFTLNFANEATRFAARTAVVCDKTDAQKAKIIAHIRNQFPLVFRNGTEITIDYANPAACVNPNHACVMVTISPGVTVPNIIPFWDLTWTVPPQSTTLTPESFASAIDGSANPVCN